MRLGNNPMRGRHAQGVPPLVAAVITHLPNQRGYHAGRLEVIQACLTSMRQNAGMDIPIYVWDNGSGDALRDWLQYEYRPDYLTMAPNMGKSSARAAILRAFPTETIVALSDDDMYFHPDWLRPQLELLNGFPDVGQVSGYPVRTQQRWGNVTTLKWAKQFAILETGRFIPEEWDRDFCASIERTYKDHLKMTEDDVDYRVRFQGYEAYAAAHHCQFVAYAGRLANIVEWTWQAMMNERRFDAAVDHAGLLRLTTTARLCQHIGNVMEDRFKTQPLNIRPEYA